VTLAFLMLFWPLISLLLAKLRTKPPSVAQAE
jgi:hypothetical protein